MRQLMPVIDPSTWMTISSLVFGILFLYLVIRVYRPSAKATHDDHSRIPLSDDAANVIEESQRK